MDIKRSRRPHITVDNETAANHYQHNLSLYTEAPAQNICAAEFDDLAINRLRLLRILEYATNIGYTIYSTEWQNCIYQELKNEKLTEYIQLLQADSNTMAGNHQICRQDHLSHHILRLIFCRTEEWQNWFINRELELFTFRLMNVSNESITKFMKIYNLKYPLVSEGDKNMYKDEINCSTCEDFDFETTTFYKMHMLQVMPLVSNHKVFVRRGYAYVPHHYINECILSSYRDILTEALNVASKRMANKYNARFIFLIKNMNQVQAVQKFRYSSKNLGKVTLSNIDQCSHYFPLCMRSIHDHFRSLHHIRHDSRLQYMIFLKDLGMIYEDILAFWREEFTKGMDVATFEKKYVYSLKHAFGNVGHKKEHAAYDCKKILSSSVAKRDINGCPYMNWDDNELKSKLTELGMNELQVNEILGAKQAGHFQIACGKLFKHMYGKENEYPIFHPNQYFEDSFMLNSKFFSIVEDNNYNQAIIDDGIVEDLEIL